MVRQEHKQNKNTNTKESKNRIIVCAGQYYDHETGLHYNYHRFYDPKLGRYLRADPIGLDGGINLYAYVQNNPIIYIDPEGKAWQAVLGRTLATMGLGGVVNGAFNAAHTQSWSGFATGFAAGAAGTAVGMVRPTAGGALNNYLTMRLNEKYLGMANNDGWDYAATTLAGAAGGAIGKIPRFFGYNDPYLSGILSVLGANLSEFILNAMAFGNGDIGDGLKEFIENLDTIKSAEAANLIDKNAKDSDGCE